MVYNFPCFRLPGSFSHKLPVFLILFRPAYLLYCLFVCPILLGRLAIISVSTSFSFLDAHRLFISFGFLSPVLLSPSFIYPLFWCQTSIWFTPESFSSLLLISIALCSAISICIGAFSFSPFFFDVCPLPPFSFYPSVFLSQTSLSPPSFSQ